MKNVNEIFRKDVTYDNIKSHKKAKKLGFTLSSVKLTPPPLSAILGSSVDQWLI